MRNTETVHGPIPLIPVRACSHDCPCRTLERISSDRRTSSTQHSARRCERPTARRLRESGTLAGERAVRSGCAALARSASRHATDVETCCAMTIRTSPQMGSSVGRSGQRAVSAEITRASLRSRAESRASAPVNDSPTSADIRHSNGFISWLPMTEFQCAQVSRGVAGIHLSRFLLVNRRWQAANRYHS